MVRRYYSAGLGQRFQLTNGQWVIKSAATGKGGARKADADILKS